MGLVSLVDALCAALADFDPEDVPAADCATLVEKLAVGEKACAVARARALARAASCDVYRARGFRDPAEWAAQLTGTSVKAADRELTVAAQLEELGDARAAAVAGELSLDQLREIALTARVCPGSETEMVTLAKGANLARLRDRGRDLRLQAMDVEVLARRQHEARDFSHWRDELGMVRGSFALEPVAGIAFVNRLEAECDRLRAEAKKKSKDGEVVEPRGRSAADAFVRMLGSGPTKGKSVRADVVCVWKLDEDRGHVIGGGPVPKSTMFELARRASIKAVVHDGVEIKTVAHYGPKMPAHLRTALELGPPPDLAGTACCCGCGRRHHLEWHHVDPQANGGAWAADNLRPHCWPSHHLDIHGEGNNGKGREPP